LINSLSGTKNAFVAFARKIFENNMVLVMDVGLKCHIRQQTGLLFKFPYCPGNGHLRRDVFKLIPATKTACAFTANSKSSFMIISSVVRLFNFCITTVMHMLYYIRTAHCQAVIFEEVCEHD
jgi:hypothetical protein